jgi:hypothetical protein
MYISLDTDKDCDLVQARPVPSTGRMPHDKQNRNCLDCNKNLVMSPGGAQRQDGLTDRLPVSYKVTVLLFRKLKQVLTDAFTSTTYGRIGPEFGSSEAAVKGRGSCDVDTRVYPKVSGLSR